MKVLQIITSMATGGAEKLLADSVPLYIQRGIDMDILVLNGNKHPFYLNLQGKGISIYALGIGSIKKIYNPIHIIKIIPYLKKYDVIHVHLFPSLYWVALAKVFSRLNVPLIYTVHNTIDRRMKSTLLNGIEKYIYSKYCRIISITKDIETIQKRRFSQIQGNKFHVISNGIDLSVFKNKSTDAIKKNDNQKTIIQVSSFSPQKDQETLIRSMQYLPDNLRLQLIGDGKMKLHCENLVNFLGLSNRVSFLGIRTDIPNLLQQADIIVLSSHYEGLSLSSIEGMASGHPFVASDVPGLRNVVKGAGLLFPQGDTKTLAKLVNRLISDQTFYDEVANACQERAKEYDICVMVDKYIELYKEVLSAQ